MVLVKQISNHPSLRNIGETDLLFFVTFPSVICICLFTLQDFLLTSSYNPNGRRLENVLEPGRVYYIK